MLFHAHEIEWHGTNYFPVIGLGMQVGYAFPKESEVICHFQQYKYMKVGATDGLNSPIRNFQISIMDQPIILSIYTLAYSLIQKCWNGKANSRFCYA